jgi:5-methylcytosine-specific restriction endonuclease McrA
MITNVLNNPILVLNKSWRAVRVETFKRSLGKVCNDRARFVDPEQFNTYSWEEWIENFSISNEVAKTVDYDVIRSVRFSVKSPTIIVCTKYNKIPVVALKLNRKNILVRDGFRCQYCGRKLNTRNSTMDHVLPRSAGGKNSWENLVICCIACNVMKANRTPAQAKMVLHCKPSKPPWNPMYSMINKKWPTDWDKVINTDKWNEKGYWDVELKE